MKQHVTYVTAFLACLLITGGFIVQISHTYTKQNTTWNNVAQEAFRNILLTEISNRGDIEIPVFIPADTLHIQTLNEPIPDSVIMESNYGRRCYKIERNKIEHSLIKQRRERILLSILLEDYPLSVDTLNSRWDSLLQVRGINAQTYVRYSSSDFLGKTTSTYSREYQEGIQADSLLSFYMGYRCEYEVTGFIAYRCLWKTLIWWQWLLLALPWGCFCLLIVYENKWQSLFQHKFVKHTVTIQEKIIEKEVIIEKEIQVANITPHPVFRYKLGDRNYFDWEEQVLYIDNKKERIPPQAADLLLLFLRAENNRLTVEEIIQKMWRKNGNMEKLHSAIRRLRKCFGNLSSIKILYDGKDAYTLRITKDTDQF